MEFIKSHGLGNDYLTLHHSTLPLTPTRVQHLCDRHRGPGSDGILEPLPSEAADYGLRIWNPDGSQAEKSGNGLRIFARYLFDHHNASADFTVEVPAGVVRCQIESDAVRVEMGQATFVPEEIPCTQRLDRSTIPVRGALLEVTAVGVGNPHCVIWFDEIVILDQHPWRLWGELLERHVAFPNRTNVQFAKRIGPNAAEIRIWERGAGETAASGSSACAVAAVAVHLGELPAGTVAVHMPGGQLDVDVDEQMNLVLRGPVEEVCAITIAKHWLSTHP